jgi:GntR family transcriptional regulator
MGAADRAELSAPPGPLLNIRRSGPVPLHHQIAAQLRREIQSGRLRPGDPLPPEGELMARFGVARGTIRQALSALRADGTIVGSRGKPPVVRAGRLAQPFSHLLSFSEWVRSLGKVPSASVAALVLRAATAEEAARLALRPRSPVYHLVRPRYADGDPLMIERSTFPPRVGELVAQLDLEHQSIYAELARRGITFASAHQLIDAVAASTEDARLLNVPARTPLLRVRRNAFSPTAEPLEWSEDRYLASRVTFSLDNTAADANISRRLAVHGRS